MDPERPDAVDEQRQPPPPRQRGGQKLLWILAAVLFVGAGLVAAGSLLAITGPMRLGLQLLGAVLLLPIALAALLFLPTVWFGWRNRPGREISWWPVKPDKTTTRTFVAERARFHGLWLCLDVHHPSERGPHYVVSAFEVTADGREVAAGRVATCWGFPGDPTGGTHMFVGTQVAGHLGVALSELELDRLVSARPTGRYRALSLLHRIRGLRPGQQVAVSLTVQAPAVTTEMGAHAFIAHSA